MDGGDGWGRPGPGDAQACLRHPRSCANTEEPSNTSGVRSRGAPPLGFRRGPRTRYFLWFSWRRAFFSKGPVLISKHGMPALETELPSPLENSVS